MTDWTLCIDFGTAFSKAAAAPTGAWTRFDPATVRPLMLNGAGAGGPPGNPRSRCANPHCFEGRCSGAGWLLRYHNGLGLASKVAAQQRRRSDVL